MKIALCDDDTVELEKVVKTVQEFIISKQPTHKVILNTFTNGDDLISHISRYGGFDLLILDIIMPGMNGIELATEIRTKDDNCKIIFLTSSPEYAVKSYMVGAFFYLMKPFTETGLIFLLNKALNSMEQEKSKSIVIKNSSNLTRVKINTIQYIESIKHTIFFHLQDNTVIPYYGSINEFTDILMSEKQFVKCHKSFVVNMNFVISISSRDFIMTDKTLVPISRQVYQQIKNAYIDYFFEKGNKS